MEEATWKDVILLPKGVGDFFGIRLVEVLWKTSAIKMENHIGKEVDYHEVLYGFLSNQGTGTASPEANLLHQLAATCEEALYKIFLYPYMAYNEMYWERCLEILEG